MVMKKKIVALIPVKSNSSRVPNKNFRNFYSYKSLLEIKIEQCLKSGIFDTVFVSSDSEEAEIISNNCGAVFLKREMRLCMDKTPWNEVLEGILTSVPVENKIFIAWCPVTSPLFSRFDEMVEKLYANVENDSIFTITPFKHYFLNADYIPINHQWGPWHAYSQGMRPLYQMNLACLIAKKETMIRNQYQIGNKPIFFETSMIEGLDIDTMEEFELTQILYTHFHGENSSNVIR
jgi:N-acylneuraminate cytidylyltransferase